MSRTQSAPQSQSAPQCQSSVSCETTLPRFAQALEGLKALFEHGVAASYTLPPVQCSSAKELALVERGTEREREIGGRGRGRGRRARAHSLSLSHARAHTASDHVGPYVGNGLGCLRCLHLRHHWYWPHHGTHTHTHTSYGLVWLRCLHLRHH